MEKVDVKSKVIHVFGDSHTNAFKYVNLVTVEMIVHDYSAASALGLGNPNSRSGVNKKIMEVINSVSSLDGLYFFFFGKVDLDFVIPFKLNSDEPLDLDQAIARSVTSYFSFLRKVEELVDAEHIYICGIHPPHLSNRLMLEALNNEERKKRIQHHVQATDIETNYFKSVESLDQRTVNVLQFNEICREESSKHGYHYIDIMHALLHPRKNRVKRRFIGDRKDHHLCPKKTGNAWEDELKKEGLH